MFFVLNSIKKTVHIHGQNWFRGIRRYKSYRTYSYDMLNLFEVFFFFNFKFFKHEKMKRSYSSAESTTLRWYAKLQVFLFFFRPDTVHRMSASCRPPLYIQVHRAGREQQTHGGRARKNKMPPQSNSISYALSATANV